MTSSHFKYFRFQAVLPAFEAISKREICMYPPSPSVFKMAGQRLEDDWCILRTNEGGQLRYVLMRRSDNGWRRSAVQNTPLSEEMERIGNGWRIPISGSVVYEPGKGLRVTYG